MTIKEYQAIQEQFTDPDGKARPVFFYFAVGKILERHNI
jgi:hypothetical protein